MAARRFVRACLSVLLGLSGAALAEVEATWVWEEPLPVGSNLYGVWGTGPDDVFVAGDNGGFAHYDGASWRLIETDTFHDFRGMHGFASDAVYLTGNDANEISRSGITYLYDGLSTAFIDIRFAGGRPNNDVWGTSETDVVLAVDGCPYFFDGVAWEPDCTGPFGEQFSVHGFGTSDLYFGQNSQLLHLDRITGTYATHAMAGTANALWVSPSNTVYAASTANAIEVFDGVVQPPFMTPGSVSGGLRGIWGTGDTSIWAVSDRIYRFDGAAFTEFERPDSTRVRLNDVWGSGPEDVFAVGETGTILHYDGTEWVRQTGALAFGGNSSGTGYESLHGTSLDNLVAGAGEVVVRTSTGWDYLEKYDMAGSVEDVWAASDTEVWAVGTKIWRWDGNTEGDWVEMDSPVSASLNRIHGISGDDFYVAARDATLLHHDGSAFSPVALPDIGGVHLNDVWMAAPDRVFVVGNDATILLFNGANWGVHAIPDLPSTDDVTAIWGEVVNDVINVFAATSSGQLLHWPGGANWEVIDTGLPLMSRNFYGLWGVRTSTTFDLFAVGRAGSFGDALIVRQHNGVYSEATIPGNDDALVDVVGSGPNDVYAVDGTRSDIYRFDGSTWSEDAFPGPDFVVELRGLGRLPGGRIIAGGRDFFLLHDTEWQTMARPVSDIGAYPDVQRTADGEIYVAGQDGSFSSWDVYHHNGMTFQRLDYRFFLDDSRRCRKFWTDGVEFFILCGQDLASTISVVHHFDGASWSTMNLPEMNGRDIWGADPDNVFVVGGAGRIAYFDGNPAGNWTLMNSGTTSILSHVHGFSATDVYVGGEDTLLLHYDGADWRSVDNPLPANTFLNLDIRSLYMDADSGLGVVGVSGRRSLLLRNGVPELFSTPKSDGFIRGVWTDGRRVVLATTGAEIIRGDLAVVFTDGFESAMTLPR